jgi:hypothetical protein
VVPALIILALWVVLLAPGVVRWFREHQPTTSIASFHRQLRLLEHSGPKLVEPAYRLGGAENWAADKWRAPTPAKVPRLVLLTSGPTQKESTMRYGDRYEAEPDDRYDANQAWDDPWGAGDPAPSAYDPPTRAHRTVRAPRARDYDQVVDDGYDYDDFDDVDDVVGLPPERAAARRRRVLVALSATIGVTFVLGLLPGLGILWAVTFLSILAMVGYLGLMLYASNTGLYGATTGHDTGTPVARVVMPTFQGGQQYDDYDDGWDQGRVAAAR